MTARVLAGCLTFRTAILQALMFAGALGDTLSKIKTKEGKLMQLVFVIPVRGPTVVFREYMAGFTTLTGS